MTLTQENKALRAGRFTASEIHKLITPGKKLATSKTSNDYVIEVAASKITGWRRDITSKQIRHGNDNELPALMMFERVSGLIVQHNTELLTMGEYVGATPDGFVVGFEGYKNATIDIKCPYSSFWSQKIDAMNGIVPHEYYWQAQLQMVVAGLQRHYLVRYFSTGEYDADGMEVELDLSDEVQMYWQIIERNDEDIDEVLIPAIAKATSTAKDYVEILKSKLQP